MYINDTQENIKVRTGNLNNYIWKTIRPGEKIDLPWHIAESTELSLINTKKEKNINSINYKKLLIDINGVGPKYTSDIMKKYPKLTDLIEAVNKCEEIHNNDRIDELVKKRVSDIHD